MNYHWLCIVAETTGTTSLTKLRRWMDRSLTQVCPCEVPSHRFTRFAVEDVHVQNRGTLLNAFLEYRFNLRLPGLGSTTFRDGKVRVLMCSSDDYTDLLDNQRTTEVFRARRWKISSSVR
ncbi:hypothetical protein RvY_04837-1 [Ramazzottius varieornatus]|uniref:Uncharacterized protein n=1 Tax=Ramazzottius varieornatus TaxID=947166 RepID=A0A1D1UW81_RAMVA|nr:hypothetical protein RvY_04837-1 [Ramazzottius varieornatus]